MADQATDVVIRARYQDTGVKLGFSGILSSLRGMAARITLITSLATTLGGAFGTVIGAQVQQNLATVGAVAGATAKELAALNAEARRIGATTAYTAAQVSESMIAMAQAGLTPRQVIASVSDAMYLAGATASDMDTATTMVAATLGQFGLKADQAKRIVDTLTYATNRSLFNLPKLAEAMRYAGTTANSLGMSVEDTVTAVAALANLGLRGEQVGTTFRMGMAQLSRGTADVRQALFDIGLLWKDVNPATHDIVTLMDNLAKATWDAGAATRVFGTEAGLNFTKLINAVKKGEISFRDFRSGIFEAQKGTGIAAQQYGQMMDTMRGDWWILKSTVQEMALTMFDDYNGFLRRSIRATTGFVRNLTSVYRTVVENFSLIMGALKQFVVKLFSDWEFLQGVSGLVTEIWVRMSLAVGDFVWALGNSVIDAAAIIWSPFEAQFNFLLDTLQYKWGNWINERIDDYVNAFKTINPLLKLIPDPFPRFDAPKYQPVMDDYWKISGEEMKVRLQAIMESFKTGLTSIKGRFDGLGEHARAALGSILPHLKKVGLGVAELKDETPVQVADDNSDEWVDQTANSVERLIQRVNTLTGLIPLIGKGLVSEQIRLQALSESAALIEQITARIKELEAMPASEESLQAISALTQGLDALSNNYELAYYKAEGFWNKLKTGFHEVGTRMGTESMTMLSVAQSLVEGFSASFTGFFSDLASDSKSALKNFAANVLDMVGKIAAMVGSLIFLIGVGFQGLGFLGFTVGGKSIAAGLALMALGGVAQGLASSMRQSNESAIKAQQDEQSSLREGVARNTEGTTKKTEVTVTVQDANGKSIMDAKGRRETQRIVLEAMRGLKDQGELQLVMA